MPTVYHYIIHNQDHKHNAERLDSVLCPVSSGSAFMDRHLSSLILIVQARMFECSSLVEPHLISHIITHPPSDKIYSVSLSTTP